MGKIIVDKQIDRLCIVDDNKASRTSFVESLNDSAFEPFSLDQQIVDVNAFINEQIGPAVAVISDHQLKKANYFPMNGAEFVALCYTKHIPSILVTRYEKTQMTEIRKFRQHIPVLINPSDFDIDCIHISLEICVREFKGIIRSDRKLQRTLVRIDAVDDTHIYIIIPGWDSSEIISIGRNELPIEVRAVVAADKRMHVKTNIGCENQNDLFFTEWEIK